MHKATLFKCFNPCKAYAIDRNLHLLLLAYILTLTTGEHSLAFYFSVVFPGRQSHKTREGHWRELREVQQK